MRRETSPWSSNAARRPSSPRTSWRRTTQAEATELALKPMAKGQSKPWSRCAASISAKVATVRPGRSRRGEVRSRPATSPLAGQSAGTRLSASTTVSASQEVPRTPVSSSRMRTLRRVRARVAAVISVCCADADALWSDIVPPRTGSRFPDSSVQYVRGCPIAGSFSGRWPPCGGSLSEGLDGVEQLAHRVLGVAEEQGGVLLEEQLVLDAREAGAHRTLHEHDLLGLVGVEDRHAVDGRARSRLRRRVDHVVGADHQDDVGVLELAVDVVHLLELLVGHLGLSEQHVHVTGHPPRDGVDRVVDLDVALAEQVDEL